MIFSAETANAEDEALLKYIRALLNPPNTRERRGFVIAVFPYDMQFDSPVPGVEGIFERGKGVLVMQSDCKARLGDLDLVRITSALPKEKAA